MTDKPTRCAIVTGAANGIGRAIALGLAKEDWTVIAGDLDDIALVEMKSISGIHPIKADVTNEADIKKLIRKAVQVGGGVQAIVSNTGVSGFASLEELTLKDWNRILATNLTPAFLLAKWGEKELRKTGGAMVLISSTRAHMSEPDTHAYSATKGGLSALTHSLAISLGSDVRVNCISPGWINVSGAKLSKKDHSQHPAGRVGVPEDIAAVVSFLLSDETRFITGAELIVDGGMTRKMIYH